jgi:hypothetical protein
VETIEINDLQKKIQLESREKPLLSDIADQRAGGGGFEPTIINLIVLFFSERKNSWSASASEMVATTGIEALTTTMSR